MQKYCRFAPSLGALEGTPELAWGTKPYRYIEHYDKPTVFFGLYDLRDYVALIRHRGKRWILWAGSDILNLKNNFLFNNGKLRLISKLFRGFPRFLDKWLSKNAEHWVENENEREILQSIGIEANVCPSFMGQKNFYPTSYEWKEQPDVYLSAHPGRQKEYGWDTIERIANETPFITFHLYGAPWITNKKNVVVHGRVKKEIMNKEIRYMQCGLRLNKNDGFSEITAKSILWAQHPIARMSYKYIKYFYDDISLIKELKSLQNEREPNIAGKKYYLDLLNNYPWSHDYKKA